MKKTHIFLTMSLSVLCGCTNLDVEIKSLYTSYPDNPIAQEAAASDCYIAHKEAINNWYNGYNMLMSVSGGENIAVSLGGNYYDNGCRARATLHNVLPGDYTLVWYSDIMSGIIKCNYTLRDLHFDNDSINKISAQLRAARSYYHFILMDGFGDTPILDRADDTTVVQRDPRKDVAAWIVSELNAVMDSLPTETNEANYAKPTRWMAQALLAKIYLNWAVYTCGDVSTYTPEMSNNKLDACIAACDDIIRSGKFDLSDDYKTKFLSSNGPQIKDFIFVSEEEDDGNIYGRYHTWRHGNDDGNGGPGLFHIALTNSVAGCFAMNPDFSALFNLPGDRRNDCLYGNDEGGIVYRYSSNYEKNYDQPTKYMGTEVKMTQTVTLAEIRDEGGNVIPLGPLYDHLDVGSSLSGLMQGWRSNKYILNANNYNYDRTSGNDIAIFRYADILLTKAEAILRGGKATGGDTPMSLFNQIRTCSHAPVLTAEPTLQDILDERGREFFDEGWRRNDMIRFGQFEKDTWLIHTINPNASDPNKRIFPIPTEILEINTNWKQNPSY